MANVVYAPCVDKGIRGRRERESGGKHREWQEAGGRRQEAGGVSRQDAPGKKACGGENSRESECRGQGHKGSIHSREGRFGAAMCSVKLIAGMEGLPFKEWRGYPPFQNQELS
jgi:hypothetical protein